MLRLYQLRAIELIRAQFRSGNKKVLLSMPTGSGKTVIFSEILKGLQEKGNHGVMLTRGRKIIDQAHQRLSREGVSHGVLMANHRHYRPNELIQLCSIDTLRARELRPKANIIVVDEAHYAVSPSFKDFISGYPEAYVLAVTATPFVSKSLRHVADTIVTPISVSDLIDQSYLVDGKYFAPRVPDLSSVKISNGDYVIDELSKIMSKSFIVGDVVTEWKKLGEARSTLCFCVDVKHSMMVCNAFNASGIASEHIDAKTPDSVRDGYIHRLEEGHVKVITSVGTMTTGVDIPSLGCIIMARPTKSYVLHVQMLGRGTRPYAGKENFLVLDHASNLMKHGTIRDVDTAGPSIDGKPIDPKLVIRTCPKCYAVFKNRPGACPQCSFIEPRVESERTLEQVDGELDEFVADPIRQRFEEHKRTQKARGYKRGWLYHTMLSEFGPEVAEKYVPRKIIPDWVKRKL